MNVDIRIILDVTEGNIDFFMSSNDDSFIVLSNNSNGFHDILLDKKYQWMQDVEDENEKLDLNITNTMKFVENRSMHGYSDDPGSSDCKSFGKFHILDKIGDRESLTTHITLSNCNTLLRVFKLKNRLIVTLPQNIHNLSGTRFFIALRSAEQTSATGLIFFRQVHVFQVLLSRH